jgi:beta-glucosidase
MKVRKEDGRYVVRFRLQNTGSRDGEEVVQLYVRFPGDDAQIRLRGFDRIALKQGEKKEVELVIPADELMLWDSGAHAFVTPKGRAKFLLGASSADTRLSKRLRL